MSDEKKKTGIMGLMDKLGPKGGVLGDLEKETMGAVIGDIIDKVKPMINPMIGGIGTLLGNNEYMAIIRNNSDNQPVLIIIETDMIESFKFSKESVVMAEVLTDFIGMALNPNGGIEKVFENIIAERKANKEKENK